MIEKQLIRLYNKILILYEERSNQQKKEIDKFRKVCQAFDDVMSVDPQGGHICRSELTKAWWQTKSALLGKPYYG